MTIMLKLLPRVQFTDPIIDHDFISFQVQEHLKFPFRTPFKPSSSSIQKVQNHFHNFTIL